MTSLAGSGMKEAAVVSGSLFVVKAGEKENREREGIAQQQFVEVSRPEPMRPEKNINTGTSAPPSF